VLFCAAWTATGSKAEELTDGTGDAPAPAAASDG
jgi:membrane protein